LFVLNIVKHTNKCNGQNIQFVKLEEKATQVRIGELQENLRAMRAMVKSKLICRTVSN
jgi:hypothetical protein